MYGMIKARPPTIRVGGLWNNPEMMMASLGPHVTIWMVHILEQNKNKPYKTKAQYLTLQKKQNYLLALVIWSTTRSIWSNLLFDYFLEDIFGEKIIV